MRILTFIQLVTSVFAHASTVPEADSAGLGRAFFLSAEYKRAAQSFEKAVGQSPRDASLYNWLGKSYARMAETSGPLRSR